LPYIKEELKWYLKGNIYDLSICEKAKIWADCVTDGKLNSNYGKYLFKDGGVDYVVETLLLDHSSRRAVIPILSAGHLQVESRDIPCTVSIGFKIRNSHLYCTVHMRSQDAVFGLGNDVPFFSIVQEMVLAYLQPAYPWLLLGPLTVFVESLHVYDRHFEMLDRLVTEQPEEFVTIPRLEAEAEVDGLRVGHGLDLPFTRWLYACE
jgi:thymidylate synthase